MHYNTFDLLFVAASQDKESKEETSSVESDYNSSDYFADTETSSCGSSEDDDVFTSNSEGKDAVEKGLTVKLFICLIHECISPVKDCFIWPGDGWDSGNKVVVGQNESNLV